MHKSIEAKINMNEVIMVKIIMEKFTMVKLELV